MPGALMQLVAYGAQDIYITGNPQVTFFKVVYRRHTNFAYETIEQTFQGKSIDFGTINNCATISRNGDLVQQMYLEIIMPNLTVYNNSSVDVTSTATWTYGVGNALISQAWLQIGGQTIDTHYGEWMNIWNELSLPDNKRNLYDSMVGNMVYVAADAQKTVMTVNEQYRLYIPLQFWFNRNSGLALPLIALQYHDVQLWLNIRAIDELINSDTGISYVINTNPQIKLWVNYVFLDTDERRRFSQATHEYLIEQVQKTDDKVVNAGTVSTSFTLNIYHPVKEINWVFVDFIHATKNNYNTGNRWLHFGKYFEAGLDVDTNRDVYMQDMFGTAKLLFNGQDRFIEQPADYFRRIQNFEHHTNYPRTPLLPACPQNVTRIGFRQYIYNYSFAISPEEHQPSGTCNFSRLENSTLWLKFIDPITGSNLYTIEHDYYIKIFATNYNILRIISGMGGLAYSS